jgi:hypothetical protein
MEAGNANKIISEISEIEKGVEVFRKILAEELIDNKTRANLLDARARQMRASVEYILSVSNEIKRESNKEMV